MTTRTEIIKAIEELKAGGYTAAEILACFKAMDFDTFTHAEWELAVSYLTNGEGAR